MELHYGCYGPMIQKAQLALGIKPDGHFGPNTLKAIQEKFSVGCLSQKEFTALNIHLDAATLAINLTGALEGTNYDQCVGNFDGAGLTMGILGFNLRYGTLQAVIRSYLQTTTPSDWLHTLAELLDVEPGVSLSHWPEKADQEYVDCFAALIKDPKWLQAQDAYALENYYIPAFNLYNLFYPGETEIWDPKNHRAIANCFDCLVQTGKPRSKSHRQQLLRYKGNIHEKLYAFMDTYYRGKRWHEDVLMRRKLFITGKHVSRKVNLALWGYT